MPIYEYHCNACDHEFEVMQKITEGPIRKCEKCGRLKAKRMISQTSFILKGSGWYVTDYSSKKPPNEGGKSTNGKDTSSESKAKPAGSEDKSSSKSKDKPKNAASKAASA
ncbi:MAG: zinc ribbon domain-containing protein [Deltaproteobacteria bacterium]|nr:zinc ribbon domain-containing protein [Deltaproteobacteria bacterium]